MRLAEEFIKLPFTFDAERLRAEVEAIPGSEWLPHPDGHPGNDALPLISLGGNPRDPGTAGPMRPTPNLARMPYIHAVLSSFGAPIGRSRLMRIEAASQATLHVDTNHYWAERVRIHIPIVTSPAIEFLCGDERLHMAAGESWIFDAWRPHNVLNPTAEKRIHLVADTVGSARFWELVERGRRGETQPFVPGETATIEFEQSNAPVVISPWEAEKHWAALAAEAGSAAGPVAAIVIPFLRDWRALWARFEAAPEGWAEYQQLVHATNERLQPLRATVELPNGTDLVEMVRQHILRPSLNPTLGSASRRVRRPRPPLPGRSRIDRPLFVVSPPRAGSTALFESLARSRDLWTVGGESHAVIEGMPELHPANRGWDSNRLTATDAAPHVAAALRGGSRRSCATATATRRPTTARRCACSRRRPRTRCGCRS